MGEPSCGIHITPARSSRKNTTQHRTAAVKRPTGQPQKRPGIVKRCGIAGPASSRVTSNPCPLPTRTCPAPVPRPAQQLPGDRVIPDRLVSFSDPGGPARSASPQRPRDPEPPGNQPGAQVAVRTRSATYPIATVVCLRLTAHRSRPRAPGGSLAAHRWQNDLERDSAEAATPRRDS